jgi:hypothetical protein
MKTITRNLKLVSSKLKKYDHTINDYVFIEDESQQSRLNQTMPVSYNVEKGVNYMHSYDGPAMGKEFYINGLKYSKIAHADIIKMMNKEETLKNN